MKQKKVLHIEGLKKSFKKKEVLKGISLELNEGEMLGLIGPNGSGKTTTIRTILDYYKPDEGSVSILGFNPFKEFCRIGPKIGVMLEHQGLYELLTAREYLTLYGGVRGLAGRELSERVDEVLKMVGLYERANDYTKIYSKGMGQRLAFGRSILNHPMLLILDEPFDGIDPESKRDLINLMATLRSTEKTAILLTSHNLTDVEQICDKIAFIKDGCIIEYGDLDYLKTKYKKEVIFNVRFRTQVSKEKLKSLLPTSSFDEEKGTMMIRLNDESEKDFVIKRLIEADLPIQEAKDEKVSLEDIYFNITAKGGK